MKKILFLFFVILSWGCFKDDCKSVQRIYKPVFQTLSAFRANIKSQSAQSPVAIGKIYLYNKYIFLNEPGFGIHVIDNSDPSNPKNVSFIYIPGNVDLAVKDHYLYADAYSDLVVFDIADPAHAVVKEFKNNVFPWQNRFYYYNNTTNPDSVLIPVDYISKDTLVDCETYNYWLTLDYVNASNPSLVFSASKPSAPAPNLGGSTARFTVLNKFLYTVDYASLFAFDLENASDPQLTSNTNINSVTGGFIETIYPFDNNLFIGSSNGMFIYNTANPAMPSYVGEFGHVRSCDPVIADNINAFVTLRSGNNCMGFTNELNILDLSADITNPTLVAKYELTNPRGLAKDGNLLFICDGESGLKVFDASDVNNLSLKQQVTMAETNDVIVWNHIALVISKDGLYQYDYSNASDLKLLSKISVGQ